ncbi:MAG TPA: GIY-YIG nuclease family protein [Micropepsaceae bacterium]|nr:GIY-YIG nuclease family protein [Micropepsaceae bacterium]
MEGKAAPEARMREFVLSEIRRLTAEDGGRVPGSETFNRITHLSHSYWKGEIWLRWSDAVREAGLVPNVKNSRLDDGRLHFDLAVAIRKFGYIPTTAELRNYRKSARLPIQKTYINHFGGKRGMLRRLKFWVRDRPEWADVAALLADVSDEEPELPRWTGAVYLMRAGPLFKIGCSRKPEQRTRRVASGVPAEAVVIHMIQTDDPYGVERYWHRRFADKRVHGEWFRLSADEIAAFRARKTQ